MVLFHQWRWLQIWPQHSSLEPFPLEAPTPAKSPAHIRTLLPSLTSCLFVGYSDYLEDLAARIECPRLNNIYIEYDVPRDDLRVSQLLQLISRSEDSRLNKFEWVEIHSSSAGCTFGFHRAHTYKPIWILLRAQEWLCSHLPSHILQVCDQFSTYLSMVRHLSIELDSDDSNLSSGGWEPLLQPFTAVSTLCVSGF